MTTMVKQPATAARPGSAPPGDPTVTFRRVAGAVALPLGFLLQAACNAVYAWASRDGGTDLGPMDETLRFYAAHSTEILVATGLALVGSLLNVAGLPTAARVLRRAAPRLSLVAVIAMIVGYLSYFGIVFFGVGTVNLAVSGVPASAVDNAAGAWLLGGFSWLFAVGNLIGSLLLGLSVIVGRRRLAGQVPRWAGVLIICWPVGHITNLIVGFELFAVVGGLLEVVGLALLARAALRMPNPEWVARG